MSANQRLSNHVERHLVAHQDDIADQRSQAAQAVAGITRFDRAVRAGDDHDLVLAVRIEQDQGDPGGLTRQRGDHRDVHPFGRQSPTRLDLERVVAQGADEQRGAPQPGGCHGLVATFAAVVPVVAAARDRLARMGQVGHACDKVDVDRADHDHAAAHTIVPPLSVRRLRPRRTAVPGP